MGDCVHILKEIYYQKGGILVIQVRKLEVHALLAVLEIYYARKIFFSVFCQYFGLDKNKKCAFLPLFRGIILHLLLCKHQ